MHSITLKELRKKKEIEFHHWRCYLFFMLKSTQFHWNYKKIYLGMSTWDIQINLAIYLLISFQSLTIFRISWYSVHKADFCCAGIWEFWGILRFSPKKGSSCLHYSSAALCLSTARSICSVWKKKISNIHFPSLWTETFGTFMKQKCSNTFKTLFDATWLAFIYTEFIRSNHAGTTSLLLPASNMVILFKVD